METGMTIEQAGRILDELKTQPAIHRGSHWGVTIMCPLGHGVAVHEYRHGYYNPAYTYDVLASECKGYGHTPEEFVSLPSLVAAYGSAAQDEEEAMTVRSREQEAASRETDLELWDAIFELAGEDLDVANRIWTSPNIKELKRIDKKLSAAGIKLGERFCWGQATYVVGLPAHCMA